MNEPAKSPMSATPEQPIDVLLAPLGAMTRRKWLKNVLVLTAASGAVYCAPSKQPVLPTDLTSLTPGEFSLFQKVIAIFLPVEKAGLLPAGQVPLMRNIDRLFKNIHPKVRGDLGIGLKLFQYGSIFLGWHFTSFDKLSDADAIAYCNKWQNGNMIQRGVFGALKQIVFMSYWREPATWGPIGYEGPVSRKNGYVSLGNAPLPLEK
jgi:hypothetical protein